VTPSRSVSVHISLTERPQFRRLVRFLEEMESLGRINADEEIQGMVDECRADLLPDADEETGD
jgi:hypothetical protein